LTSGDPSAAKGFPFVQKPWRAAELATLLAA
jgi:hypothetical protein